MTVVDPRPEFVAVFAGHRRAVPYVPEPADPVEWPHSEVERFHLTPARCAPAAVETVRQHRPPAEGAVLIGATLPHVLFDTPPLRRPQESEAAQPTITGEPR
ncbi:hypothetical protein ACWCPF_42830 [Streptomyces sp. NPDC001858]